MRARSILCCLFSVAAVSAGGVQTSVASPAPPAADRFENPAIAASAQAQQSGEPVTIPSLTDENSTTQALPDGSYNESISVVPQRVRVGGAWRDLDASLVENADGSFSPSVSSMPLKLSGGGAGPLATMQSEAGVNLSLSWPTALPKPDIDGSTAMYRDVLAGVDLEVFAQESGGMSEVLIVHDATAAANPRLNELKVAVHTADATVRSDAADNVTISAQGGDVAFRSPTPLMWDSGDSTAQPTDSSSDADPAVTPPTAAEIAPVDVQVASNGSGDSMTLSPDLDLLRGQDTTYPVYIDPAYIPISKTATGYAWAQQAFPNSSWYNTASNGQPAVGYQGWQAGSQGRNRSYFQFELGFSGNAKTVSAAGLYLTETDTGLASCSAAYRIEVYNAGRIGPSTTWNNQPSRSAFQSAENVKGASNDNGCGDQQIHFGVTPAIAADDNGIVAFRVQAPDDSETNKNYYRRFGGSVKKAVLKVNYNTAPDVPTGLSMSPASSSGSLCGATGWVGSVAGNGYTLAATVDDDDFGKTPVNGDATQLVQAQFVVWDRGGDGSVADPNNYIPYGSAAGQSPFVGRRSSVSKSIPGSGLKNGHLYGVAVRGYDQIDYSPGSGNCFFWYDSTAPTTPTVVSSGSDFNTDGTGSGTVGSAGKFNISSSDVVPAGAGYSQVSYFRYSFSSAAEVTNGSGQTIGAVTRNGAAVTTNIPFTPTTWGTQYLFVAAVDVAGNQSNTMVYPFYVKDSDTLKVVPGDVDGDQRPDMLAVAGGHLYVSRTSSTGGTHVPALKSAAPDTSAPNGSNWNGTFIAHRSSVDGSTTGNRADDLWALNPTQGVLRLYANNLYGGDLTKGYYDDGNARSIQPPDCDGCLGYTPTWSDVTQIQAPGDLNGDGQPDLVMTKADGSLWFYPGTTSGSLDVPQRLGDSGWGSWTLINPGDSTGDGVPDLWAIDNRPVSNGGTGTLRMYRTVVSNGTVSLAAPASVTNDYTPSSRRLSASPGDTDKDGLPELYSITPSGTLTQNEVTGTSATSIQFGAASVVDDGAGAVNWNSVTALS